MAHTPDRALRNPIYSKIDDEIQHLRNSQPKKDETGSSRRITYDTARKRFERYVNYYKRSESYVYILLIRPPGNDHANRDSRRETVKQFNHPLDLTYGRTHEDV